jgi:hypothetical protein
MATITYSGTSSGSQGLTAGSLSFTTAGTWTLNTDSDIVTTVYLWGGGGGNHNRTGYSYGSGGAGGYTKGNITLLANSTYKLVVGGGGHGDGQTQSNATGGGGKGGATGATKAGGGGGYTGLFLTSITQANAKAIAGGGGVTFPATQSASSDVNTLDDYEEGTWTPALGGTATYTTQVATYTKIGRQVHIRFRLKVNALGTGSTTTVSGLPFTVAADAYSGSVSFFESAAVNAYWVGCYAVASGTSVKFTIQAGLDGSVLNEAAVWGNSTDIIGDVTYFV